MSRSPNTCAAVRRAARGFTLIELLVVLIIIAVIIAIVLPALGLARKAARAATTRGMMTNITNAAGKFINDNKRSPGYFTAREMAITQNQTEGFTAMQNVMLDLAGGVVAPGSQPMPQAGDVLVGPGSSPAGQVWVRPDLMGSAGSNASTLYFVPDPKHWVAQNSAGQQVGTANNIAMRSVVDDFGNPLLAWVIDDTAVGQIRQVNDFAKVGISSPTTDRSARFYWTPNAAFLGASALGNRGYDQIDPNSGSMISSGSQPADLESSLCGLLGSPSFPYRDPAAAGGPAPIVPASARAPFVLQSAGADGIFVGKKDRGAKQFTQPFIDYQMGFVKTAGASEIQANFYLDKDGKREIIDVTKAFDDLLVTGGN